MPALNNEKELEDFIYQNHKDYNAQFAHQFMLQQPDLGAYGRPDLLGINIYSDIGEVYIDISVYELKHGQLNSSCVEQICRYKKCLDRIIKTQYNLRKSICKVNIDGYLIGSKIDMSGSFVYLTEQIDWLHIYTYDLSLTDGLVFENHSDWYNKAEDLDKISGKFNNKFTGLVNRYIKKAKTHESELKKQVEISDLDHIATKYNIEEGCPA